MCSESASTLHAQHCGILDEWYSYGYDRDVYVRLEELRHEYRGCRHVYKLGDWTAELRYHRPHGVYSTDNGAVPRRTLG